MLCCATRRGRVGRLIAMPQSSKTLKTDRATPAGNINCLDRNGNRPARLHYSRCQATGTNRPQRLHHGIKLRVENWPFLADQFLSSMSNAGLSWRAHQSARTNPSSIAAVAGRRSRTCQTSRIRCAVPPVARASSPAIRSCSLAGATSNGRRRSLMQTSGMAHLITF
jgi:hypothetical protein